MSTSLESQLEQLQDAKSHDFDSYDLGDCKLNILLNSKRLCYCIINETNQIIHLNDIVKVEYDNSSSFSYNDLKHIFSKQEVFASKFASVKVGLQANYHCSIAKELCTSDTIKNAYDLCVPNLPHNETFSIEQSDLLEDYTVLFPIAKKLELELCDSLNSDFIIVSAFSSFINSVAKENSLFSPNKMYLNFYENKFDIVIINAGKLKYANTLTYLNEDDFLYQTLSVGQLNKFSFEKEALVISGFYNHESKYYKALSDYAHKIELANEPLDLSLPSEFFEISNHHYYNLYCL